MEFGRLLSSLAMIHAKMVGPGMTVVGRGVVKGLEAGR